MLGRRAFSQRINYYQVLNIDPSAKKEEIKAAYRALVKLYHPDISKDPSSQIKFKQITEAYTVLYDLQSRMTYDLTKGTKEEIQDILSKKRDKDGLDVAPRTFSPHQYGYKRLKELADERKRLNLDKFYRYKGGLPQKDQGGARGEGFGIPGERVSPAPVNFFSRGGELAAFASGTVDTAEASMFKVAKGMDSASYTTKRPFIPAEIDYTLLDFPIIKKYIIFYTLVGGFLFGTFIYPEIPRLANRMKLAKYIELSVHGKVPGAGLKAVSLS